MSLRGDGYLTNGNPQTFGSSGGVNTEGRILPRATLDWSWPLVGETGRWQHSIEPIVMFTAAPTGGNSGQIPNEDSQDFEFDDTNVFEPNRFPGLDRVDGGTRFAYGMRFNSQREGGMTVSGLIGQDFQFQKNKAFPSGSGVTSNFSDIVGRLDFRPNRYLNTSYRFRMDKQTFVMRRNDLNVAVGPPSLRFDIGYLELSDEPTSLAPKNCKELTAGVRVQLLDDLAIAAQTCQDLSANSTVSNMIGLLYTNPCLTIAAGLERQNTQTGDLQNETTFKIQISLTGLGGNSTGTGLFGG